MPDTKHFQKANEFADDSVVFIDYVQNATYSSGGNFAALLNKRAGR